MARPAIHPGEILADELEYLGMSAAELARILHVPTNRVTQIMNLLNLAPEIQEELLFLPRLELGRGEVCLRDLQKLVTKVEWREHWPLYVG